MNPHQERITRFRAAPLYVVITEAFCAGRPPLQILHACLEAGVRLIQFREKNLEARELHTRATAFREMTANAGALLIIDDRLDIALAVHADGVHLGQNDLPIAAARAIAPDLILGASTHSPEQARAAQGAGASYVNIGPIYPTQTKQLTLPPLGPAAVAAVAAAVHIPFTCMGGIKQHHIPELRTCGAQHVAVVTAVTAAADPAAAVVELMQDMVRPIS